MKNEISILMPVRPNSLVFPGFVDSFFSKTADFEKTELLIMKSKQEELNERLFDFLERDMNPRIVVLRERETYGQVGHHIYLNRLLRYSIGDWLLPLCDDERFVYDGWDDYLREYIEEKRLDSKKVYQIHPARTCAGDVQCMISRGMVDVTGRISGYPNTDSWTNYVVGHVWLATKQERRIYPPQEILHTDFSTSSTSVKIRVHSNRNVTLPYGPWKCDSLVEAMDEEVNKIVLAMKKGK